MPDCFGFALVFAALWCPGITDRPTPARACPPLQSYTRQQQARAAEELEKLGPGSVAAQFIGHYGTLRARCRAYGQ